MEKCFGCRCGTVPYPPNTCLRTPKPTLDSPEVWSFESEPEMHPMKVTVNVYKPGTTSGLVFVAPFTASDYSTYGQSGSLIQDNGGNPVWFRPLSSPNLMNTDFRVQELCGEPVLTFWQGTIATPSVYTDLPSGSSEPGSCYYIIDNRYQIIKTVTAQRGFTSDIHEFLLTPRGTALLLSTKAVPMDLTCYGGPQNGYVQDFAIQEIDLKTDELVFFWSALQHIPLEDSYEPISSVSSSNNIWDAYHLNSIGLTDCEDEILVSGRNTWTIYKINKCTGRFVWRLGGKESDFQIARGAEFSWQHDARFLANNVISMFDDNCCEDNTVPPGTPPSRGLLLQLHFCNKTATKYRAYYHDPNLNVSTMGNVQSLKNGHKFVGWGQSQYYSEYRDEGDLLYDVQLPSNNYSYRAYRHDWNGRPHYPPSIAVKIEDDQTTVYASWNGSTETASWQVYSGSSPINLSLAATATKSGFETAIPVTTKCPYFQVIALDAGGKVLGTSSIITA